MSTADSHSDHRTLLSRLLGGAAWHIVLAGTVLAMTFPILWALLTSFKPPGEIFSTDLIGSGFTWENYAHVLDTWPVATLVGNTFVMAAGVALGQVVIAVLAAFALVHFDPRGRRMIMALMALALIIPPQALIVPQFLATAKLGWLNTDVGLIVPQLGSAALAVLILVQHVRAVPPSLVDAARMEGASSFEILWHVVLPGLRSAISAVAILVFITTWNEYLWPLLVSSRPEDTTVQIGLQQFMTEQGNDYGGLLAAATLTSLPIVAVYVVASRRITDAFLQSGLK